MKGDFMPYVAHLCSSSKLGCRGAERLRAPQRFRRPPYPARLSRVRTCTSMRASLFVSSPTCHTYVFTVAPARPNRPPQPAPRGTSGRDSIRSPFLFCVLTY